MADLRFFIDSKCDTARDILFMEYEQLISDPQDICYRLDDFLCRYFTMPDTRDLRHSRMANVIRTDLCHAPEAPINHQGSIALDAGQQALYEGLLRLCRNNSQSPSLGSETLYGGWREYLTLWESVSAFIGAVKR